MQLRLEANMVILTRLLMSFFRGVNLSIALFSPPTGLDGYSKTQCVVMPAICMFSFLLSAYLLVKSHVVQSVLELSLRGKGQWV